MDGYLLEPLPQKGLEGLFSSRCGTKGSLGLVSLVDSVVSEDWMF